LIHPERVRRAVEDQAPLPPKPWAGVGLPGQLGRGSHFTSPLKAPRPGLRGYGPQASLTSATLAMDRDLFNARPAAHAERAKLEEIPPEGHATCKSA
jgi:hypothetical protein